LQAENRYVTQKVKRVAHVNRTLILDATCSGQLLILFDMRDNKVPLVQIPYLPKEVAPVVFVQHFCT
jgi:hypothetical protein